MIQFNKTIEDNEFDNTNVTFTIPNNSVTLEELCESLTMFVKACGYQIDGKIVTIIDEEQTTSRRLAPYDIVLNPKAPTYETLNDIVTGIVERYNISIEKTVQDDGKIRISFN